MTGGAMARDVGTMPEWDARLAVSTTGGTTEWVNVLGDAEVAAADNAEGSNGIKEGVIGALRVEDTPGADAAGHGSRVHRGGPVLGRHRNKGREAKPTYGWARPPIRGPSKLDGAVHRVAVE